ncbi:hypothetical protein [Aeromicrobium sp. Root495]|uniref:hypothetical protein n=1 Tax=Aeromicrobium sp. Root495 TaxID=1736550 RepID=UPI000AC18B96|nr:hypothetical protein [Aeromicrobium sp. Root495]
MANSKITVAALALALVGAVSGGFAVGSASAGSAPTTTQTDPGSTQADEPHVDPVASGTTPDGRTFGPVPLNEEATPDLVAVYADNGKFGYADSAVVLGDDEKAPSSPAEALATQRAHEESAAAGGTSTIEVPADAPDGGTKIGVYTVSLVSQPKD